MKIKKIKIMVLTVFCLAMAAAMPAAAQQVPDWAVGTFTARNPQSGGTIVLTIDRNGSVTANLDGSLNYGNINGNRLTLNGIASRVRRQGNGIRTTRIDNGERIDYVRGGNAGGGGNGNVPDWAVGTFTARNPQTGGVIVLTIDGNGNATANLDGTINNGSYDNGRLTINGIISNVRSQGNGIRTTRIDNGERIDYVRGGNSGGGNIGNVPDWAIGTFRARSPQDGTTIILTIDRNGNVSANVNGTLNNGTIYQDRLTINGVTSRVQRNGDGIRTTRLDNGERINYNRQR
jgi:hypothetical protein